VLQVWLARPSHDRRPSTQSKKRRHARPNGIEHGTPHAHKATTMGGAHLPQSRKVTEHFLQQRLKAGAVAHADLAEHVEDACGCSLLPNWTLSRKGMPGDNKALFSMSQRGAKRRACDSSPEQRSQRRMRERDEAPVLPAVRRTEGEALTKAKKDRSESGQDSPVGSIAWRSRKEALEDGAKANR